MLQLGGGCPGVELPGLRKQVFLAASGEAGVDVVGEASQLPFATSSINAVFLSHLLEFATDPHGVLREADRVLIPGGRLVIALYNPWSLFGLWRFLHPGYASWGWRLRSPSRMAEWLSVLGFELERRDYLGYQLPFKDSGLYRRFPRLEHLGSRLCSKGGAVAMLMATKRELPMNIIRPRWSAKPSSGLVVGRVVEPELRQEQRD